MDSPAKNDNETNDDLIVYIEDSDSDRQIFELAFKKAGFSNQVRYFKNGEEALKFLKESGVVPFIIISDVNMPKMNGFELKNEIEKDEALRMKAIPFVYLSTSASRKDVKTAYYHQAQGYFEKPLEISEMTDILKLIMTYWTKSELPVTWQ